MLDNGGRVQKFPLCSTADELLSEERGDEFMTASCIPEQAAELAAEAAKTVRNLCDKLCGP